MRGVVAKRLRWAARQMTSKPSEYVRHPNGSILLSSGTAKTYRDLKRKWMTLVWDDQRKLPRPIIGSSFLLRAVHAGYKGFIGKPGDK